MKTIESQNLPFYSGKSGKQVKDHIKNLSQNSSGSKVLYAPETAIQTVLTEWSSPSFGGSTVRLVPRKELM